MELLADIFRIVWFLFLLDVGLFFGALAALILRVTIDLLRAGPSAVDEAYAAGDSLSGWWNGTHPNPTSTGIVGRRHKKYGVVMEESGSRSPSWARD